MLVTFNKVRINIPQSLPLLVAGGLLVTFPVFVQAPLVRSYPWLSLILSLGWFSWSRQSPQPWGSLLWGFGWTWLCGSLYWGWYRGEPLWHLPMEGLALPWAIWGLGQRQYRVGSCFYLGSLWGTIVTDLYFWLNNLLPAWRGIVDGSPAAVGTVLYAVGQQLQSPWGLGTAILLTASLIWLAQSVVGPRAADRAVFAGAVLFTVVTDLLFALTVFMLTSESSGIMLL